MKNTDKVILTVGQLKKLVKESNIINDNVFDQIELLNDLKNAVEISIVEARQMTREGDRNRQYRENNYRKGLQRILKYAKEIEKFDAVAL